ncbi:MAG: hypothetical protein L0241_19695 [Planctomycetia bacterium]|nr:hypothetical protein [Planctomycetia bacterium]
MRLSVVTVMLTAMVGQADAQVIQAGGSEPFAGPVMIQTVGDNPFNRGMTRRTVLFDGRTGLVVPTVTRVQPVIGSIQRKSHFANPFTHKARYTGTVYDPQLGQFSKHHFRR